MGSIQRSQSRGVSSSQSVETVDIQHVDRMCFIGAGYVGASSAIVMAAMHPRIQIDVVDKKAELITAWNSKRLPILEPNLDDLLLRGCNNRRLPNITFSVDIQRCIKRAQMVFICVDTPSKNSKYKGCDDLDTAALNAAVIDISEAAVGHTIVVEKSTVPFGTAERIYKILETKARPGATFSVLSNPEFLAQGTAIHDLLQPSRIVIGWVPGVHASRSVEALTRLYSKWVSPKRIVTMNAWSSELSKIASNAFVAQRISSINSLSAICEASGADVDDISRVVGMEPGTSSADLRAGFGYSGSCLRKDVLCLVYLAKSLGLNEVAAYWRAVHDMNEYQNSRISRRTLECISSPGTEQRKKRIAVLGFAYRRGTTDTRGSSAIQLVREFLDAGSQVAIHDTHVTEQQTMQALGVPISSERDSPVLYKSSPYDACRGAQALLIHTDWDEFSQHGGINWVQVAEAMEEPRILVTPFQSLEMAKMKRLGFSILKIGKAFDGEGF
ncbi:UDP-glucose 6-dehydrogenase [Phlyctema vagabunda]|uniref:UDP-glucose 6-dehydrogenase n=1 Tax=Phlyctema vagabunda TaxID=108571 RepID=A0ABR4P6V1_9HELO